MVLNDEIGQEKAKTYSALVRSVAQLKSIETARARMRKEIADLGFEEGF